MINKHGCELFSSGLRGAEAAFGEAAEKYSVKETVLTFSGHKIARNNAGHIVTLSSEDLARGDISMEIVSATMNRTYYEAKKIRKVLQIIFHVVNNGHQVFVVGEILDDGTVKGGTGWSVELAKLFNRPLSVFDQKEEKWYSWLEGSWQESTPTIQFSTFVGSGTRNLTEAGRQAIEKLFEDSFDG